MCPNTRTEHRTESIGGVSIHLEVEYSWSPLIINEVIRAFDDTGGLIFSWARSRNYDPILEFRLQSEFKNVCASLVMITEPGKGTPKTILIDNGRYHVHGVFKSPEIQYLAVYKGILIIHEDPTSVSLEEVHTFLCTI
jgi:hypothetical protein